MALRFGRTGSGVAVKAQNLGQGVPMPNAGTCPFCNQWDSQLGKDGFCRDAECRRGRQLYNFARGKAIFYTDDGNGRIKLARR